MIVVGLDPGTNTGFAVWNVIQQRLTVVTSYTIHRAMNALRAERDACGFDGSNLLVMFEDARRSRIRGGKTFGQVGRLQGAGSVKRDCAIWQEFLEDLSVPYVASAPIHGGTKWDSGRFNSVTGWKSQTNEHGRDAGVRVFQLNEPQVRAMVREWQQRRARRQESMKP